MMRLIAKAVTIATAPRMVKAPSLRTLAVITAQTNPSARTTATAIFQSSPMMKSYQN